MSREEICRSNIVFPASDVNIDIVGLNKPERRNAGGGASLGFSDCLVLEISCKAGHVLLGSFDLHLGKLEGPTH
jgi:hypothetical protein